MLSSTRNKDFRRVHTLAINQRTIRRAITNHRVMVVTIDKKLLPDHRLEPTTALQESREAPQLSLSVRWSISIWR
jgi:hypothetical protein